MSKKARFINGLRVLVQMPFKQGVRGSNPRWSTTKTLKAQCFQGFLVFMHKTKPTNISADRLYITNYSIFLRTQAEIHLIIHLSKNPICSSVWNQCSPFSITVKSAPMLSANVFMVSIDCKLSALPYKIEVGTLQEIG